MFNPWCVSLSFNLSTPMGTISMVEELKRPAVFDVTSLIGDVVQSTDVFQLVVIQLRAVAL